MANRLLLLASLLGVTCHAAWAQDPAGAEFQVNTYATGPQLTPAAASDASGNFVVVWHSLGQDASSFGIFGQRFDAFGVPQAREFQVNTYTTGYQFNPAVASDANGNFVVVWQSNGQDGSYDGVFGQRFRAGGPPLGAEFQVNSSTTWGQDSPAVAFDANGNFVVVWSSFGQDGAMQGVFGQRFNASGVPQGSEFQVNSYNTGRQERPAVASAGNGDFVVVWQSDAQDASGSGVFGQRFNASGVPQGGEFRVNTYAPGDQAVPAVASDASGNFVVVWSSYGQDASGWGVFGRRFNASGVPQGGEFRVNSYTTANQFESAVASDANGNFVVVWHSDYQEGSNGGVFGQRFSAVGVPQGNEFQVNSHTTSNQRYPAVASAANGNFVVVWQSYGQDESHYGVFGQRYGDVIFKDGFQ